MLKCVQFDGDHDTITPVELVVTGKIPIYAAGTLYRVGPGGHRLDTDKGTTWTASHWFDGFAWVHRFQIIASSKPGAQTRVLYNSRKTVDKMIENIRKAGDLKGFSFGQRRDPCESYFKKAMSLFYTGVDQENINVTFSVNLPGLPDKSTKKEGKGHASGIQTLWIKTDSKSLKQIDPETLEPMGVAEQSKLHPDLKGPMSAAHAKSDPITGDVYNYNCEVGGKSTYRIFRVSASTGKTDILATIRNAKGAYIHSFFLTENHVVLCVWNSYYAYGGLKLVWEQNILDALSPFDASIPTIFYVIDRKHGKGLIATYDSPAFFSFHTINAYEEPCKTDPSKTDIVADLVAYDNMDILKRFYYENMKSTSPGSRAYVSEKGDSARPIIRRFRLPAISDATSKTETKRKAIAEFSAPKTQSVELPTINPRYATHPHRYVYGMSDTGSSSIFDGLLKYDTRTHKTIAWKHHGQTPGEAIFIPNPEGTEEDDGVLLSVVLDGMKGKSYLLVLDPRDMSEVGRAAMETSVMFGFHGVHVQNGGVTMDA